jgi:hypothetical protein
MPAASVAEARALLVGVSDYDDTIGLADLRGPANDVRLYAETLAARGVTDLRLLADGVAGATRPTRDAILSGLAALAADSTDGDLVFIAMSGHGTRQPDRNGDEGDGLDEVFLPADTARAQPGSAAIPNAITDDDLGAAILAIQATGADVWFVMDSCHSGSGLRAGDPASAARFVDPALLGVDAAPRGTEDTAPADTAPTDAVSGADVPGGLIAFYAARASEVAREVDLTPAVDGDAGWYGLFSSRVAARMQDGGALTYRQFFQAVLSDMNDTALPGGARLQTPSWEGDLADAPVFGGTDAVGLRQFAVAGDRIEAGLVHGLRDGSLVALVADAAAAPDDRIALAQVELAEPTQAWLQLVADDCAPAPGTLCPSLGLPPAAARFGRILARPLDTRLRLSVPALLATGAALAPDDPLSRALADAVAEVNAGAEARVDPGSADYAIEVAAHDGRLWFARRAALDGQPMGLSWAPGDGVPLAALLVRMARAEELAAVLSSVAAGGSPLRPPPVDVAAAVTEAAVADLDPPGQQGNPVRECTRAARRAMAAGSAPLADAPDLKQCDLLGFSVQGAIPGARDVNRIHIDARFCVSAEHVHVEDAAAALPLGEQMVVCSDCPDGYAAGDERLFVLITESPDNAEQLNLEGLVETCGQGAAATTRSAAAAGAATFLERLGRRPDTRGNFGGLAISDVWVTEYRWRVLPKAVLFATAPGGTP